MSLKLWLCLFICSMALSAEVLAWAVQHGQFRDVNRGNVMPLRGPGGAPAARRRPWVMAAIWISTGAIAAVCIDGLVRIIQLAFY